MTRLRINDTEAGMMIAGLSQAVFTPGRDACFSSHREDGSFLGGTILTNYTGVSMMIHDGSVSEHWLIRDLLWATFHYPFVQLGCTSLIGTIPSDNPNALVLAMKVGFKVETVIHDCLPGGAHMLITRMWRDECRWLHKPARGIRCNLTSAGGA